MKPLLIISLLILLFIHPLAFSEDTIPRKVLISGKIFDAKQLSPMPSVHFRINKNKAGKTNDKGEFIILANINDTIRFTHIGYKDVKAIITDSLLQGSYIMGVFMHTDTIHLAEIIISPRFKEEKSIMDVSEQNERMQKNATKAIQVAKYQAYNYAPKTLDADMHMKLAMEQFKADAESKGMIPSDQTVNFVSAVFWVYKIIQNLTDEKDMQKFHINKSETDYLQLYYKEHFYNKMFKSEQ